MVPWHQTFEKPTEDTETNHSTNLSHNYAFLNSDLRPCVTWSHSVMNSDRFSSCETLSILPFAGLERREQFHLLRYGGRFEDRSG
jgi:hypothetical protein